MISEAAAALCRKSFRAFAYRAFEEVAPGERVEWNWHVDAVCEHLEAVASGDLQRLIINVPPRSLKSYLCSIAFPAWVIGNDPSEKFMVASHTLRPLAAKLSNDTRRLVDCKWYKATFPLMKLAKSTETEFYTTQNGHRMAFAEGQTPTGTGCNFGVLDDLNKPDNVLTDTVRTGVNNWVDGTFMSRFNDYRTGKLICVMQRLHENDVTGHLLEKGGYTLLKLPAEFETRPTIHIDRTVNGKKVTKKFVAEDPHLLFPARLPKKVLDQKRIDLGEFAYAGQFMQNPVPIGGGLFKTEWFKRYDQDVFNAARCNVYITCDPANSKKKGSDYTVFAVIGLNVDNNYYLLDLVKDKLNPTERINKLFELHRKWNKKTGKSPKVGYEQYGLTSDLHWIEAKQKADSYYFAIEKLSGNGSKVDRIARLIPIIESGRFFFPKYIKYTNTSKQCIDIMQETLDKEFMLFPVSKHDDAMDAIARITDDDFNAIFPMLTQTDTGGRRKRLETLSWYDF